MIVQIQMELQGEGLHHHMGSILHGYLMQSIDPAYAAYFHANSTNPYSSCLYQDRASKAYIWRLCSYNQKAHEMLTKPLLANMPKNIYLEQKKETYNIANYRVVQTSFEEIFCKTKESQKIKLLTPTSFKSEGSTQIFPKASSLLQGVIEKINAHSDSLRLADEGLIKELLDKVYIKDYHLRTAIFHLQGIKLKGFMGSIDWAVRENKELSSILRFLLAASEYTGLGMKTALGMGGVELEYDR